MADSAQTLDLNQLTTDEVLDALIEVRQAIDWLKARNASLLDRLNQLVEAGEIDQGGFSHQNYSFAWSAGRKSWVYPAGVVSLETQAEAAKKAAQADGSATPTTGASFWTIKPPKKS